MTANGYGVSFWGDGIVPRLNCGDGCKIFLNLLRLGLSPKHIFPGEHTSVILSSMILSLAICFCPSKLSRLPGLFLDFVDDLKLHHQGHSSSLSCLDITIFFFPLRSRQSTGPLPFHSLFTLTGSGFTTGLC